MPVDAFIRANRNLRYQSSDCGSRKRHQESLQSIGRLRTGEDQRRPMGTTTVDDPEPCPTRIGLHQPVSSARAATRSASDAS